MLWISLSFACKINISHNMKKILLLLSGIAGFAFGSYAQCGDGINTLKVFTPSGSTYANRVWNNANHWTPTGVPDCDDNVRIQNGIVYVDMDVTVRDINVHAASGQVGKLRFDANQTVTCRNLVLTGGSVETRDVNNSTIIADSVSLAFNSQFTVRFLTVKRRIAQGNSKVNIMPNGIADLKHVVMNNYARLEGPTGWSTNNNSRIDIRGDFFMAELASFTHNKGLIRFIDTGRNMINTAGTSGKIREFWNVEFNKKLDNAGDVTVPGKLITPWTSNERWIIHNKLHIKEVSLENWNTSEYLEVRDSLVVDSTMSNNLSTNGFGINGIPGEQGGVYILMTGDLNSKFVSNGAMHGMYNIKINKSSSSKTVTVTGKSQEIGTRKNYVDITQGILAFDGTRNCRITANAVPTGLVVRSGGRLIAPDDDTLYFNGCWNFNNTNSFNAQNSTVVLDGKGNKASFAHNQDTIFLNNLVLRTSGATSGTPASLTWNATQDRLYVRGNMTVDDTSGAYLSNVQLFLAGNLESKQTQANTGSKFPDRVWFVGGKNQTVTLSSAAKGAYGNTVTLKKDSGTVTLNSAMEVRDVTFTSGILNTTSSNKLTITRPDFIRGGSSTSYISGPVRILNGGNWNTGANTTGMVPVGGSGNYRPIGFSGASNNEFEITYTAANSKSGDAANTPIDEVSSTDLWRIDHVSGSTNYKVKVFLTGKPASWNNTEVRIAAQAEGSAPWYNQGGTYYSSDNMILSNNVDITKTYMLFTHGRDVPAPMAIGREDISGLEVATVKAGAEVAKPEAKLAVRFNVYPNPVQNVLNLQVQNADKGVVTLSDMSGKMLGMFNAAEVKTVDMSNLSPGMYIVSFTDGLNNIRHRVIKH